MNASPTFAKGAPLGYLVSEVAKLMKRRFEEEARVHGITLPQWRALAELSINHGMSQVELAGCIDTDPMTLSGILDRLEKRGLIERSPDPNDSRAKRAVATRAGQELMLDVRRVGATLYEHAVDGLSDKERKQIIDVLTRMKDNLLAMSAEEKELAE
jgi:DNA-binding MarR family transcriptional regulator